MNFNTLILLDACRFDAFKEIVAPEFKGTLSRIQSKGGDTEEWIGNQLYNRILRNVGCITAQPFLDYDWIKSKGMPPPTFKFIDSVWKHSWDDKLNTVHPKSIVESVRNHNNEKRLLIWIMQPHWPFIDEDGNRLLEEESNKWEWYRTSKDTEINPWFALREGLIDLDTVKDAYYRTLKFVLPYLKEIVDMRMDRGKIFITSDHGNLFGYPYGHNKELRQPGVRVVPWMAIN